MHILTTLAILGVALAAPASTDAAYRIPFSKRVITPRVNGEANYAAIFASLNRTLSKYKAKPLPFYPAIAAEQIAQGLIPGASLAKRAQTGTEVLTDDLDNPGPLDVDYHGPGTIGSPGQNFQLDFDTGSADLFVPGEACDPSQCDYPSPHYNPADSSSARDLGKTASITYGSGSISGEQYADKVTVAGLTVASQTFIAVAQATGFSTGGFDGLMGMGFSSIAETGAPTFFENLISEGLVSANEFSFYLGRGQSGTQGASELVLGGRDPARFTGSTTAVPVTKKGYWQVKLDGVKVDQNLLGLPGILAQGQAAIDTGTTLILAPTLSAISIFAQIPGSFPISMGVDATFFVFPCKAATEYKVSLVFAGKNFVIDPLDFNLGAVGPVLGIDLGNSTLANMLTNDLCVASVMGADLDPLENLYIVGDTFLKNWYSTYNYNGTNGPQVEFTKAV